MRQAGLALMMYEQDTAKLPLKTQAVFNFASGFAPANALKQLFPYLGSESSTPVFACPSLKPNPNPAYAPTAASKTGYLANAVVLGRHSPLWGCSDLAALAAAKIPRRRTPPNFKTRS